MEKEYFKTTNIVTTLTGLDLLRKAVAIVPNKFINDFLFDEQWILKKLPGGTFYLVINRLWKLDWAYHKTTQKDLDLFGEDGPPDTEVDADTFLFLLRGLYARELNTRQTTER